MCCHFRFHSVTVGRNCWGCHDKDSQTLNPRNIRSQFWGPDVQDQGAVLARPCPL